MAINTELLEKVKQHILEEPRRYDQRTYGKDSADAPCGTRACIAGWTVVLGGEATAEELKKGLSRSIFDVAANLLNLTERQADVLFHSDPHCFCGTKWPAPFDSEYLKAEGAEGRARVAADYIDHIIATGKVTD